MTDSLDHEGFAASFACFGFFGPDHPECRKCRDGEQCRCKKNGYPVVWAEERLDEKSSVGAPPAEGEEN
jgi:hypothetical protein